jgi:hypothetical protein
MLPFFKKQSLALRDQFVIQYAPEVHVWLQVSRSDLFPYDSLGIGRGNFFPNTFDQSAKNSEI